MADAQWNTELSAESLDFITGFNAETLEFGITWDIIATSVVTVTATRLENGVEIEVKDVNGTTTGIIYDGHTPEKGVDYFTAADIEEIVAAVQTQVVVTYIHSQMSASAEWTINHNMGKYPSVAVVDSAGNAILGEVQYINENSLVVGFSAPFAGKAYLN
jgi:hypothetical protein